MRRINLRAMAKINLSLDVVGTRPDGYHDLRMVMQSVRLSDQVTVSPTRAPGVRMKTNLRYLPADQTNLAARAAALVMEECGVRDGVFINLEKHIPVAAGLAGGSSDAAAVLVAMNLLFGLRLPQEKLREMGKRLGADIPFCVMRGTALAEGIGEQLTRLPDAPDTHVLIAKPPIHVSTGFVYGNLKADQLAYHPDIDAQVQAIRDGDFYKMASLMGNVLETVTIPAHPVIQEIKDCMMEHGAVNAMMSGSGPTVFGLFDDLEKAQAAYETLSGSEMAKSVFLTKFFHVERS